MGLALRLARRGYGRTAPNPMVGAVLVKQGRVTGVRARIKGVVTEITAAKGVVLASGGFSANAEMRKAYIPFAEQHVSILPYDNTGDGIAAATAAGARAAHSGDHINPAGNDLEPSACPGPDWWQL